MRRGRPLQPITPHQNTISKVIDMKLDNALALLESVRLMADDGQDSLARDAVALNVIHILVEFIDNDKIRSKVDEIPC